MARHKFSKAQKEAGDAGLLKAFKSGKNKEGKRIPKARMPGMAALLLSKGLITEAEARKKGWKPKEGSNVSKPKTAKKVAKKTAKAKKPAKKAAAKKAAKKTAAKRGAKKAAKRATKKTAAKKPAKKAAKGRKPAKKAAKGRKPAKKAAKGRKPAKRRAKKGILPPGYHLGGTPKFVEYPVVKNRKRAKKGAKKAAKRGARKG